MEFFLLAVAKNGDGDRAILALGAFFCSCLYFGFQNLSRARRIRDTAVSKTASAAQGQVELEGFAWPMEQPLVSLNHIPVVYHALKLQQYKKVGKSHQWITIWTKPCYANFYLCDETGACVVQTIDSFVTCESRTERLSKLTASEKHVLNNLLDGEVGYLPTGDGLLSSLFTSGYRIIEERIPVGSFVYTMGKFNSLEGGPRILEDLRLNRLTSKLKDYRINSARFKAVMDSDRNGTISEEEYQRGFGIVGRSAFSSPSSLPDREPTKKDPYLVHGLLCKGDEKCEISTFGQNQLLNKLRWRIWGSFIGGGVSLWFLLQILFHDNTLLRTTVSLLLRH